MKADKLDLSTEDETRIISVVKEMVSRHDFTKGALAIDPSDVADQLSEIGKSYILVQAGIGENIMDLQPEIEKSVGTKAVKVTDRIFNRRFLKEMPPDCEKSGRKYLPWRNRPATSLYFPAQKDGKTMDSIFEAYQQQQFVMLKGRNQKYSSDVQKRIVEGVMPQDAPLLLPSHGERPALEQGN